jgi:hypothetical protein
VQYTALGRIDPGATCQALGRSGDGQWWLVQAPASLAPAERTWVSANWVSAAGAEHVPTVNAQGQVLALPDETPAAPGPAAMALTRSPAEDEVLSIGADFDAVWLIYNDTGVAWEPSQVSVRFVSALNDVPIHKHGPRYHLLSSVPLDASYEVRVDIKLPDYAGVFGKTWAIVQGGRTFPNRNPSSNYTSPTNTIPHIARFKNRA